MTCEICGCNQCRNRDCQRPITGKLVTWPASTRQVDWDGIREYLASIKTTDPESESK